MILLDTNIISEVMRTSPRPEIIHWLNNQGSQNLYLSTITIAEINYGLKSLPKGRRRLRLEAKFEEFIQKGFTQRILNFDEKAVQRYGDIMSTRKSMGRPMSVPDGQIAAIAFSQGFDIATGNQKDFEGCGAKVINPFIQ